MILRREIRLLLTWLCCVRIMPELVAQQLPKSVQAAYENYDYDAVMNACESYVASTGEAKKDALQFIGLAGYRKGELLSAAFEAAKIFSAKLYECVEKSKSVTQSDFLLFAKAMTNVAREQYETALASLQTFTDQTRESEWKTTATIWIGAIHEKHGKRSERDAAWNGLDWSKPIHESERIAARAVLRTPQQGKTVISSSATSRALRNATLVPSSLSAVSVNEKLKMLRAVSPSREIYTTKSGSKFYDIFSLKAAANISFSVASDALREWAKLASNADRKRFGEGAAFFAAHAAYLLGDFGGAIQALQKETLPQSLAVLGAAYHRRGERTKGEEIWNSLLRTNDPNALSWLGLLFAELQVKLDLAESFARKATEGGGDQESFLHLAAVYHAKNDLAKRRMVLNDGYNYQFRGKLDGNNTPEYVIHFCGAQYAAGATDVIFVNELLVPIKQKYSDLALLHELATSNTICREMNMQR